MPLQPDRVKFRKMHRGSRTGIARSGHTVAFGEYGLMALERCWMDSKQIEAKLLRTLVAVLDVFGDGAVDRHLQRRRTVRNGNGRSARYRRWGSTRTRSAPSFAPDSEPDS